jgi:hypothetical protein
MARQSACGEEGRWARVLGHLERGASRCAEHVIETPIVKFVGVRSQHAHQQGPISALLAERVSISPARRLWSRSLAAGDHALDVIAYTTHGYATRRLRWRVL